MVIAALIHIPCRLMKWKKKIHTRRTTGKRKYKDQISIYLGIEQDVLGKRFEKNDPFDYIIGSVHFVNVADQYLAVDMDKNTTEKIVEFCGDFLTYAKVYYEEVKRLLLWMKWIS